MIKKDFYCYGCKEYTNQEIVKTKEGFEVLVCQECGFRHSSYHTHNCPKCGSETIEEDYYCELEDCNQKQDIDCDDCPHFKLQTTLVKTTEPRFSCATAIMYGGTPYDWVETHECWRCGTIFELVNSNY